MRAASVFASWAWTVMLLSVAGTMGCEDPLLGTGCLQDEDCPNGRCVNRSCIPEGGCAPGETRLCGTNEGACSAGQQGCLDGVWGACEGGVVPIQELCNGQDDNCDGVIPADELDADADGSRACEGDCDDDDPGRHPGAQELCDGVDNDCDPSTVDGAQDTALGGACDGPDADQCEEGTLECVSGAPACSDSTDDTVELCDNIDNDCDGIIDNNVQVVSWYLDSDGDRFGAGMATEACSAPSTMHVMVSGDCNDQDPLIYPGAAEACDGQDNDCDVATLDGAEEPTLGDACDGADLDLCEEGVIVCAGGALGCDDTTDDIPELCDGVDNDCDPSTLDGASEPTLGDPCDGPDADLCEEGQLVCQSSNMACNDTTDDLVELCDGVDNDCDPNTVDGAGVMFTPQTLSCPASWDRRPIVEFDPLPSANRYDLYLDADPVPIAQITAAGQNYYRPPLALGAGGPPPGANHTISLTSCAVNGAFECCVQAAPVTVNLIEACTTPIAPNANNILISEYVTDGDGLPCPGAGCEAGEAIEITNLSHCPVSMANHHFAYCNPVSCAAFRWIDFDASVVIPPRGVYVAIRDIGSSMCSYDPDLFGPGSSTELFGLAASTLQVQGNGLNNGWLNNGGGGLSRMRIATGAFVDMSSGTTIDEIAPYSGAAGECESYGLDAFDACGNFSGVSTPDTRLNANQLGRLWRPCDAVVNPVPAPCQ